MIAGKGDFSDGVTTLTRVSPQQGPGLVRADGYRCGTPSLAPRRGTAQLSSGLIAPNGSNILPSVHRVGSEQWLVSQDDSDLVRHCNVAATNPAWAAANANLGGVMPEHGTFSRYGDQIIYPTLSGVKRFEPAAVGSTLPRSVLLGMKSPAEYDEDAAPTVARGTFTVDQLAICETYAAWIAEDTAITVSDDLQQYSEGTRSIRFTCADVTGTDLAYHTFTGANLNVNSWQHRLAARLYVPSLPSGDVTIIFRLYSVADKGGGWVFYTYPIPLLAGVGWYTAISTLHPAPGMSWWTEYEVRSVDIALSGGDLDNSVFCLDWTVIGTAEELGGWAAVPEWYSAGRLTEEYVTTTALDDYEYRYCYVGPSTREGISTAQIVSNPCLESDTAEKVGPGNVIDVTCPVPDDAGGLDVTDECDATHVAVYRRASQSTLWEYAGKAAIATPVFSDDGTAGDYETDGVPQYLEENHDAPPSARYIMAADRRVYAACLDYDSTSGTWRRPTAIQISNWDAPWYFPSTTDDTSDPGDGAVIDNYAVSGTEFRGWGVFKQQKIAFLDNECFVLRGDDWQTGWLPVRLAGVGLTSQASVADCIDRLIWHWGDDFYSYDGASLGRISRWRIDTSLIDWTQPHSAAYYDEQYVLYCVYDGLTSLLIYDLLSGAWNVWNVPEMTSIASDPDGSKLYGINAVGFAVTLDTRTDGLHYIDTGQTQAVTYEVETANWVLNTPGFDSEVVYFVADIESDALSSDPTLLHVTVEVMGLKEEGDHTTSFDLAVSSAASRYRHAVRLRGHAAKITVQVTSGDPPTIHYLGIDADELPLRR